MPLFKTIPIPGGLIGLWKFAETTAELLPEFSGEDLDDPAFRKYTHEKRIVEWLATRLLIRQLIGPDFAISYLSSGKPNLKHDRYKHLSISHSRDFAAVILHERLNVGIDIEETARDYNRIEKKYLSDLEIGQIDKNQRLHCLYWCAKEAIFKLVDDEGIEFRNQIHIIPKPENQFLARFISGERESGYELHHQFISEHCLVWVTDHQPIQE
jgi:4'-phosphopantetheinyl transferase